MRDSDDIYYCSIPALVTVARIIVLFPEALFIVLPLRKSSSPATSLGFIVRYVYRAVRHVWYTFRKFGFLPISALIRPADIWVSGTYPSPPLYFVEQLTVSWLCYYQDLAIKFEFQINSD